MRLGTFPNLPISQSTPLISIGFSQKRTTRKFVGTEISASSFDTWDFVRRPFNKKFPWRGDAFSVVHTQVVQDRRRLLWWKVITSDIKTLNIHHPLRNTPWGEPCSALCSCRSYPKLSWQQAYLSPICACLPICSKRDYYVLAYGTW